MAAQSRPVVSSIVLLEIADLHEAITVDGGDKQVRLVRTWMSSMDRQTLDDLPILDNDIVSALSQALDLGSVGTSGLTLVLTEWKPKK